MSKKNDRNGKFLEDGSWSEAAKNIAGKSGTNVTISIDENVDQGAITIRSSTSPRADASITSGSIASDKGSVTSGSRSFDLPSDSKVYSAVSAAYDRAKRDGTLSVEEAKGFDLLRKTIAEVTSDSIVNKADRQRIIDTAGSIAPKAKSRTRN